MNRAIVIVFAICNIIASSYSSYAQERNSPMIEFDHEGLLSSEQVERERALRALTLSQLSSRQNILGVLQETSRMSPMDARYMSSLHCAIRAVEVWRVYEAESILLSVVDYELDSRSLPDGLDVGGEFFYPAANALVSLRVEPLNVVSAMAGRAEDEKQTKLLTWVLTQRTGSTESAITLIERRIEDRGSSANLVMSVDLLKSVEVPAELLRRPSE